MNSNCQHKENADSNAAKVIKSRLINVKIREELGKDNVYHCSRVKPIYYKVVKTIIDKEYKTGVITELFPINPLGFKTKKDSLINH